MDTGELIGRAEVLPIGEKPVERVFMGPSALIVPPLNEMTLPESSPFEKRIESDALALLMAPSLFTSNTMGPSTLPDTRMSYSFLRVGALESDFGSFGSAPSRSNPLPKSSPLNAIANA